MLVKVNAGKAETHINVDLNDIAQVSISRNGQPGYRYVRGAWSGFELKNGQKYLTNDDEAQRIVDAMRQLDNK